MNIVIITGLSGAGKTIAMHAFEDMGYYCVDNLPSQLLPTFIELCEQSANVDKVAAVMDIRGGKFFDQLEFLTALSHPVQILFLEADDRTLVARFKESRRNHPLTPDGSVERGIDLERERMSPMRARSDVILDTTAITAAQLRQKLFALFALDGTQGKLLNISLISFGFKYGLPMDADLVFDIRFLPNPHYQEALRDLTGLEPAVKDYVMGWTLTHQFLKKVKDLLAFLVPCYIAEGKTQLIIAVGCTGGKHRSVTIANILATFFTDLGQNVSTMHRDIDKA
mgnify:FL=1|jgi:UPF0042 nucleotide-binding protein